MKFTWQLSSWFKALVARKVMYSTPEPLPHAKKIVISVQKTSHICVQISFQIIDSKGDLMASMPAVTLLEGDTLTVSDIDQAFHINVIK